MVNLSLHRGALVDILRGIYSDILLRSILGFKGGSAAMLFYSLPRFSVDLDFDLLEPDKKEEVFQGLKEILPKFGIVDQAQEKQNTLFFLINYGKGERKLKVEISKRPFRGDYEIKNYLGISMLVMKEEGMIASKLAALLTRRKFATRDIFDLWYFLKQGWQIDDRIIKTNTNMDLVEALKKAQDIVQSVKKNKLLALLGELLPDQKQKAFVREKLQEELAFQLRLYGDNIKRVK